MSQQKDIYNHKNMEVRHANGQYITTLNVLLVKKQNLSADTIEMLKMTHVARAIIFTTMRNTNVTIALKRLALIFENLEYIQQELWGFEKNKNNHMWFEVPKCSCPKLDNIDYNSSELRIIDRKCIIHGMENDQ